MGNPPDLAEINEIVQDAKSGAAEVNQRITNAYHRLSEAARAALGAGDNLDWCGFAKWSSHTVGFDLNPQLTGLRTDEIANLIFAKLPAALRPFRPRIIELLREATDVEDGLVIKALRAGNAMIFREMGSLFFHLLERLGERRDSTTKSNREFAEEIIAEVMAGPARHLEPPLDRTMFGDPDEAVLVEAITLYLRAAQEPGHRAELMLAANILFSVYEQDRADRLITIGTCAPVRARIVAILKDLSILSDEQADKLLLEGRQPGVDDSPVGKDLVRPFVTAVEESVASVLTDKALVVEIAGQRVRLGHPELLTAQVVPTLPEVKAVVADQASSAPRNWLDLRYRLAFISSYFAAFQQKPGATAEPRHLA